MSARECIGQPERLDGRIDCLAKAFAIRTGQGHAKHLCLAVRRRIPTASFNICSAPILVVKGPCRQKWPKRVLFRCAAHRMDKLVVRFRIVQL
jgi:hypothetical protein